MILGEKIKLLREKKGFSRKQVAEYLGIPQSEYVRMERGEYNPWAFDLDELSDSFKASIIEAANTHERVLNNKIKDDYTQNNDVYVINRLSKKLIEQYELSIAEKDGIIEELKEQVNELREQLKKYSK